MVRRDLHVFLALLPSVATRTHNNSKVASMRAINSRRVLNTCMHSDMSWKVTKLLIFIFFILWNVTKCTDARFTL